MNWMVCQIGSLPVLDQKVVTLSLDQALRIDGERVRRSKPLVVGDEAEGFRDGQHFGRTALIRYVYRTRRTACAVILRGKDIF